MEERKQKRNVSNIFYAVVGIATLIVSVIGATFAYFTATDANNATIKGDMAIIDFDLDVEPATDADETIGMIPMSNNMVEMAVSDASGKGVCVDNNNNAVCQIYKIKVVNTSTASMFVDGYVTLTGGSGTPTDIITGDDPKTQATEIREWKYSATGAETTMRWAQVFCDEEDNDGMVSECSTAGNSTTRAIKYNTVSDPVALSSLVEASQGVPATTLGSAAVKSDGKNRGEIKFVEPITGSKDDISSVTDNTHTINGNPYLIIDKNYIRISDKLATDTGYDRNKDITSALVYSQYIEPNDNNANNNDGTSKGTGTSGTEAYKDAQVYYFVVWLSETGFNQTVSTDAELISYFRGTVKFISSQGSEVTATFANHARVPSNNITN